MKTQVSGSYNRFIEMKGFVLFRWCEVREQRKRKNLEFFGRADPKAARTRLMVDLRFYLCAKIRRGDLPLIIIVY